ncbi:GNAT family N-acetyltransferase [Bacillus sp. JCM 19041]|uniref:GNAT family N-acetyltransferase n=1 Tax=Bacillus sp. JCM 19041 TaxID=1460637 RepID=UPI0006CFCBE5
MEMKEIQKEEAWELRHIVMYPTKKQSTVWLKDDDSGVHYGLYVKGKLVSVVSLFLKGENAQFRKFATLVEEQGKGYGTFLLRQVLNEAERNGVKRIWCNARWNKRDFYKRFNLIETDETFNRGGIDYVIMEKVKDKK